MGKKEKSPAFQFYPKDYLTDPNVMLMSSQEKGIYIDLLCHCWLQKSLPTNLEELAQFAKIDPRDFETAWNHVIKKCFKERRGRLIQKRLSKERGKQMRYSKAQSDRAKNGWAKYRVRKPNRNASDPLSTVPGHPAGNAFQFASSTAVITPISPLAEKAFQKFWDTYPKKSDTLKARSAFLAVPQDQWGQLAEALAKYREYVTRNKLEESRVKSCHNFLSDWRGWLNYTPLDHGTVKRKMLTATEDELRRVRG